MAVATRFADLVRPRLGESLEACFAAASATLLVKFAACLKRDRDALRGAITTSWSTSPVEGQIGRLKMLKRTMFGRAGFGCRASVPSPRPDLAFCATRNANKPLFNAR